MNKVVLGVAMTAIALGASACSGSVEKATVSPVAAAATSSPTAEPTQQPTTAPVPPAPYFASSDVCQHSRCELKGAVDGVRTEQGVLRVEVFEMLANAGGDSVEDVHYVALYRAGDQVWLSRGFRGLYGPADKDKAHSAIEVDRAGRIFVPFGVGAHSGFAVVVDANEPTVRTFDSIPVDEGDLGRFYGGQPGDTGVDITGDGVDEVVTIQNDCKPYCAAGTKTQHYYEYSTGDFHLLGCTVETTATKGYERPTVKAGAEGCTD